MYIYAYSICRIWTQYLVEGKFKDQKYPICKNKNKMWNFWIWFKGVGMYVEKFGALFLRQWQQLQASMETCKVSKWKFENTGELLTFALRYSNEEIKYNPWINNNKIIHFIKSNNFILYYTNMSIQIILWQQCSNYY